MSANQHIRGIHSLATARHPDAPVYRVGILLQPHLPEGTPADARGIANAPGEESRELGEVCSWTAQVRLGSGEWGSPVGYGKEPEDALGSLLNGYRAGLDAARTRQAGVLTRVFTGVPAESGWQWHSVTCDAVTREPDGYVTVDTAGEVRLDGKPLSEVKDADVLTWVAKAVAIFMATGKRSPIPGSPTTRVVLNVTVDPTKLENLHSKVGDALKDLRYGGD